MSAQSQEISSLEDTVAALRVDYERSVSANAVSQKDLQENLIASKHELLRVQEQLNMAEKVRRWGNSLPPASNCWVKETVDAFIFSIVNVICLFVVCRSWRRSSSKLRPIATWRKSWPRRMSRSKILGNDCRGECSSSNPIAVIHFSLVSFCQTTQVKTGRVFQGFCFCFCYVTTMCLSVLIRLGTKNTWFWSGTHYGLASKICYGCHKAAGNVCRSP